METECRSAGMKARSGAGDAAVHAACMPQLGLGIPQGSTPCFHEAVGLRLLEMSW